MKAACGITIFQPVKHGIEHPVSPFHLAAGAFLDLLNDRVAIAFALGQQRQNQRLGGSGDEFFTNHETINT